MIITTTHGDIEDHELTLNTEKVDNDQELTNIVEYWRVTPERCTEEGHDLSVQQPDGVWAERVHRSVRVIQKQGIAVSGAAGGVS